MIKFSPVFDVNYYRASYPEMSLFPDDVVKEHAEHFAKKEGRSTCMYDRFECMQQILGEIIRMGKFDILELGPFDSPFCEGDRVKYFDVLDSEQLKIRAGKLNRKGHRVPPKIDFVSPTGDLRVVDGLFDIVFSSHVIEHQVNLIEHIQLVENILKEDGLYIMYIPDKRYCFDHFIPESSVADAIRVFVEKPKVHSFQHVLEARCMMTHNYSIRHWMGDHGNIEIHIESLQNAINEYLNSDGKYIDVHAWRFTPKSFGHIVDVLNRLGFFRLKIYRLCHTVWGRMDFCAILCKESRWKNEVANV